jgi:short-subunit dehydrogenase
MSTTDGIPPVRGAGPNGAGLARRRHALVTGASSGIGRELSRLLAADGYDLAIVGRNSGALEELSRELHARYGVSVRSFPRDLSEPAASSRLWGELVEAAIEVDVLVNDAGVGMYGPVADADPTTLAAMLELNVVALTTLTRLVLPAMLQRRSGRILNVASVVAYQPAGPRMTAYYASKSYVLSFSKGLARELKGTGLSVTALCPGLTRTAFEARSEASDTVLYKLLPSMSAHAVAVAGYRGLKRGADVVIPGVFAKLLAFAGELPPRWIALQVNRLLLREVAARGQRAEHRHE